MTTYLLAGGGTAGHVNPLLAIADRIRDREPDSVVLVLGTKEGLEARLVPERGYELLTIARLPFPRRPGRALVEFPAKFRRAVNETKNYLTTRKVDVVVGFGGYASAPVYRAAKALGIPYALHEANARPGFANRAGARAASAVGVAFRETKLPHATWVGMPLRREIEQLDRAASRADALKFFELSTDKPTLLVTGGSTGARSINATVFAAAPSILGAGWQILHIAGNGSELAESPDPSYQILKYCDRMDLAIAAADLAIARAGSATVSEFAAVGLPAVFVPYPVGNGEQRFNAADAVNAGGALLVDDAAFTLGWIDATLVPLLGDQAAIAQLSKNIATVGARDGADRMVALVSGILQ
jgi:UDP-N-acetylglucosamine--N-acetylmuramyl-(pentapeptide) pyrophosphoryl-undecaprenol N-acetylglucosamine transferase